MKQFIIAVLIILLSMAPIAAAPNILSGHIVEVQPPPGAAIILPDRIRIAWGAPLELYVDGELAARVTLDDIEVAQPRPAFPPWIAPAAIGAVAAWIICEIVHHK